MKALNLTATPTVTAGAYSANDAVGGKLTFSGVGQNAFMAGKVFGVTILDKAKQNAALVLVLFNADFTATPDNDPFDPSDADLANCIGIISIAGSDYGSFNDNSLAYKDINGPHFKLPGDGTTPIYGQLYTTGTPTYASTSDLKVTLHVGVND